MKFALASQVLAFCLPFAANATAPLPPTVVHETDLSIQHLEGRFRVSALGAPILEQVRRAIQRGYLDALPGTSEVEILRDALAVFGPNVSSSTTPYGYVWVWNPTTGRWEPICTLAERFTVTFGDLGTVVVEAKEKTILR